MSITPSVSQAKVGDYVTFTIVAENYGPGPAEISVNTSSASKGLMFGGSTSANCGLINGPAPQPGTYGNDGSWCEYFGSSPAGTTVTDTLVMQIAPSSTGAASDTACVSNADGRHTDPNASNDCATATVNVDNATCPSSMPGATETLDGNTYKLEGEDTFANDAPVGSFASTSMSQVVYTGDHELQWTEYPDGWPSTHSGTAPGYEPSTVQSVHDGLLDFYLHKDAHGNPVGASISPAPTGTSPPGYQTYGAWSLCELLAPSDYYKLADFHQATLLWPQNDSDGPAAESDFPEADLNATPTLDSLNQWSAYAHYGGSGAQDYVRIAQQDPGFDPTQWHVYTQTWGPGFRSYYVDGKLIGTSTNQVWSLPERWQLQIEPSVAGEAPGAVPSAGHVYVKWVWIGSYPTH